MVRLVHVPEDRGDWKGWEKTASISQKWQRPIMCAVATLKLKHHHTDKPESREGLASLGNKLSFLISQVCLHCMQKKNGEREEEVFTVMPFLIISYLLVLDLILIHTQMCLVFFIWIGIQCLHVCLVTRHMRSHACTNSNFNEVGKLSKTWIWSSKYNNGALDCWAAKAVHQANNNSSYCPQFPNTYCVVKRKGDVTKR